VETGSGSYRLSATRSRQEGVPKPADHTNRPPPPVAHGRVHADDATRPQVGNPSHPPIAFPARRAIERSRHRSTHPRPCRLLARPRPPEQPRAGRERGGPAPMLQLLHPKAGARHEVVHRSSRTLRRPTRRRRTPSSGTCRTPRGRWSPSPATSTAAQDAVQLLARGQAPLLRGRLPYPAEGAHLGPAAAST
jgi:hypothetical protein